MWRRLLSSHLKTLATTTTATAAAPTRSIISPSASLSCLRHFNADGAVKKRVEDAFGSFYHNGMRYSTTVPNDPDTHEDFKPTNKLDSSGLSLNDVVEQDVKDNPVMIYMKGVPDFPQCGFSSLAVRVLKQYDVPLSARNILEDPELKSAVKTFSHWPTFPQIFIKGEFIGGSDIILNLHQTGELKEKLKDVAANQQKSE
uniref:Glutaredoxin domain-containing protein n=1 Tax=Fagus sylvatica TaxID=28930 RepID=A0A2N9G2J0_FAGSY